MIEFKQDTHQYFLDGKPLISVTQLMRKHGLAPDYGNVPQSVLTAKAERGTLVHKEIEDYIKLGEIGFTSEMSAFKDYIEKTNTVVNFSEQILFNDIVAGTADLILQEKENEHIIADIKTTATIHKDAVSWQLSIYARLWKGKMPITKGQAFHFDNDGNLNVVDIPLKPAEEVDKLFECERNGTQYRQELTVGETNLDKLYSLEQIIKDCESRKKQAEEEEKKLREALIAEMEKGAVKTFENDYIRITYVAPQTRCTIDSARLKKELPEIAEKYQKETSVKSSLKITIKEQSNE